ncbi:MAG: hypothetical protein SGI91_16735 [Alphaproteobacteria bacterium]|nr:hypothetical protein [Alphaproteobacteria bacterium]
MLGRLGVFGVGFAMLSLPLAYMIVTSKDQTPWLIGGAVYFVVGALIGNWYVPFGARVDAATFWKWLLLNVSAGVVIALGYLNIVGVLRF